MRLYSLRVWKEHKPFPPTQLDFLFQGEQRANDAMRALIFSHNVLSMEIAVGDENGWVIINKWER